ncbi:MAG TPA: Gfo/Idh/MocA family oxidoreductase, partial [Pilimelia sp.]|nr:Gfo/Idh/MocA family oxidoreductase [Pilimelia sp.]
MTFGLLGTGYWAAETHAAALAVHPEADFVGVWGRDAGKTQALATRYGVRAYDDVDALIADVDAVAVALPPDVQAELAARAAAAGRHLLLDKPLALDVAAADRVVAAVRDRGLASVVFFTSRFFPTVEDFLTGLAGDGPWHGARATRLSSAFQPGSPYANSPWRRERGGL